MPIEPTTEPVVSPPRAQLAFRVSIVGHRPNRLPKDPLGQKALRMRIGAVLGAVRQAVFDFQSGARDADLYAPGPPILRAISSLAEGSDRIFAEEALQLGYSLCCPMPFSQAAFEEDFVPGSELDSVGRFRSLLDQARRGAGLQIFELDGARTSEEAKAAAYRFAGRVVLNQSDLMMVVWDGGKSAGAGGTLDTLRDALRHRVPVLWIDAMAPFGWMVLRSETDLTYSETDERRTPTNIPSPDSEQEHRKIAAAVSQVVREEIGLPPHQFTSEKLWAARMISPDASEEARVQVEDYFAERRRPANIFFFWKLFRNLIGDLRLAFPRIRTSDFVESIRRTWPTTDDEAAGIPIAPPAAAAPRPIYWVNRALRSHFAWSDHLADNYADAYRSAFLLSYLLAAAAVLTAVTALLIGLTGRQTGNVSGAELAMRSGEFVMLLFILLLLFVGRFRRWHQRWMEYRLLAELIRELRFLIPLGGGRPLPRTPTHLAIYGDPAQTWMYWQVRAIARATGVPSVEVTPSYIEDCLDSLIEIVDDPARGQRAFHEINWKRYEHLHERLHWTSFAIFCSTIVAVIVSLALLYLGKAERANDAYGYWALILAAFLPAFASALVGINNHGEFLRISKRSHAMAEGFGRFAEIIRGLRGRLDQGERVSLEDVTPLASKMAETMIDEVIDWRAVVLDRPQTAE